MLRLYRTFLLLYPAVYRTEFAEEMAWVFRQASNGISNSSLLTRVRFYLREVFGLITGAVRARLAAMFGFDFLPFRRFTMRPGFRFPRSTVFLMFVILAGVALAIEKAKIIIEMKQALPPGTLSAWHPMLWGLLVALAAVLGAVGIAWGILFSLQRTGVHRLAKLQTWPEQR